MAVAFYTTHHDVTEVGIGAYGAAKREIRNLPMRLARHGFKTGEAF